ncbi:VOC family protein [Halobacteria archaeon HArc-gm2]|nr:VOC family protein [Halobacteria archaeon HArc-gm2]
MNDSDTSRARLVGINHVALEVGDVDDALDFYGEIFAFGLRGRTGSGAFLDMGDQFLALSEVDDPEDSDQHHHFGLVVDDADAVERRLEALDVEMLPVSGLDFLDPWGNRIQVVDYEEIQFTKADRVLHGMGFDGLEKSDDAVAELDEKGMAPPDE